MIGGEFFNKLSDEILEASNHISTRFEEGLSVLLNGKLPEGSESQDGGTASAADAHYGYSVEDLEDLDLDGLSQEEIDQIIQQQSMDWSPLEGIADGVIADIVSRQAGPSSPLEHFHAFRSAITWSETFILSLLAFQVFMFLVCLWASRNHRALGWRVVVMVVIGVIVRSAEWLNGMGARNWQHFATQNYFDKRGIFVGIMLCGPLLLDSFMMLVFFVLEASQLLVDVKRGELARKKKAAKTKSEGRAKTSKGTKSD